MALVVYKPPSSSLLSEITKGHIDEVEATQFVGLSNQGATCYLNGLIQTLFMTPEFRRAIFTWNYDPIKDGTEEFCIPLQLQRLFGLLQLSTSSIAVDTVALTKSFGWGGSEVFQQQDVQELTRVLFDALEESFKGTESEHIIDQIYAGELIDYIRCIDVDYKSERVDKFLDFSLAIVPFGSEIPMHSLSECIEMFLRPEILSGDNKYYAEEFDRKVDAIKGLKFGKLPLIMSVQLKRFVYDFSGENIVQKKLNDVVKFPMILDMNKYVAVKARSSSGNDSDNGVDDIANEEFEQFLKEQLDKLNDEQTQTEESVEGGGDAAARDDGCSSQQKEAYSANLYSSTRIEEIDVEFEGEDEDDDSPVPELIDIEAPAEPSEQAGASGVGLQGTGDDVNNTEIAMHELGFSDSAVLHSRDSSLAAHIGPPVRAQPLLSVQQVEDGGISEESQWDETSPKGGRGVDRIDQNDGLADQCTKTTNTSTSTSTSASNTRSDSPGGEDEDGICYDSMADEEVERLISARGGWIYELYAVLVHSGAIAGGHYYAYIKDLRTKQWWNFNDSTVTAVDESVVKGAWGSRVSYSSTPPRASSSAYSSSYSSSAFGNYYSSSYGTAVSSTISNSATSSSLSTANAYMLMYRKVTSPVSNRVAFPEDDLVPEYIQNAVKEEQEKKLAKEREEEELRNRLNVKVQWNGVDYIVFSKRTELYMDLLAAVWETLGLSKVIPVVFDPSSSSSSAGPSLCDTVKGNGSATTATLDVSAELECSEDATSIISGVTAITSTHNNSMSPSSGADQPNSLSAGGSIASSVDGAQEAGSSVGETTVEGGCSAATPQLETASATASTTALSKSDLAEKPSPEAPSQTLPLSKPTSTACALRTDSGPQVSRNAIPYHLFRLRNYNSYSKLKTEAFDLETVGHKQLWDLHFNEYKTYLLETRTADDEWEVYHTEGISLLMEEFDSASCSFKEPRTVRLRKGSTVLELKQMVSKWVSYPVEELQIVKIANFGFTDARLEILDADHRRVREELYIMDGSKLYLEQKPRRVTGSTSATAASGGSNPSEEPADVKVAGESGSMVDESGLDIDTSTSAGTEIKGGEGGSAETEVLSMAFEAYLAAKNKIEIRINKPPENLFNTPLLVDARWTVTELRAMIGRELQHPPEDLRLFKQSLKGQELKNGNPIISSSGIYSGIAIAVAFGKPTPTGHFSLSFSLFNAVGYKPGIHYLPDCPSIEETVSNRISEVLSEEPAWLTEDPVVEDLSDFAVSSGSRAGGAGAGDGTIVGKSDSVTAGSDDGNNASTVTMVNTLGIVKGGTPKSSSSGAAAAGRGFGCVSSQQPAGSRTVGTDAGNDDADAEADTEVTEILADIDAAAVRNGKYVVSVEDNTRESAPVPAVATVVTATSCDASTRAITASATATATVTAAVAATVTATAAWREEGYGDASVSGREGGEGGGGGGVITAADYMFDDDDDDEFGLVAAVGNAADYSRRPAGEGGRRRRRREGERQGEEQVGEGDEDLCETLSNEGVADNNEQLSAQDEDEQLFESLIDSHPDASGVEALGDALLVQGRGVSFEENVPLDDGHGEGHRKGEEAGGAGAALNGGRRTSVSPTEEGVSEGGWEACWETNLPWGVNPGLGLATAYPAASVAAGPLLVATAIDSPLSGEKSDSRGPKKEFPSLQRAASSAPVSSSSAVSEAMRATAYMRLNASTDFDEEEGEQAENENDCAGSDLSAPMYGPIRSVKPITAAMAAADSSSAGSGSSSSAEAGFQQHMSMAMNDDIEASGFGELMVKNSNTMAQFESLDDVVSGIFVQNTTPVSEVREDITRQLIAAGKLAPGTSPRRLRIRDKIGQNPTRILRDGKTFSDNQVYLFDSKALAIQILDEEEEVGVDLRKEAVTASCEGEVEGEEKPFVAAAGAVPQAPVFFDAPTITMVQRVDPPIGSVVVLVQRWLRSTWSLGEKIEVFLDGSRTISAISRGLAALMDINPITLLAMVVPKDTEFYYSELSKRSPNRNYGRSWFDPTKEPKLLRYMSHEMRLQEGDLLLLQDSSEPLMELSPADRKSVEIVEIASRSPYIDSWSTSSIGASTYYPNASSLHLPAAIGSSSSSFSSFASSGARASNGVKIKTHKDRVRDELELLRQRAASGSYLLAAPADAGSGADGSVSSNPFDELDDSDIAAICGNPGGINAGTITTATGTGTGAGAGRARGQRTDDADAFLADHDVSDTSNMRPQLNIYSQHEFQKQGGFGLFDDIS